MPTIDQLPPAVSVSDTDEFVVSQSDIARSATRAQVLSGVQAALALPSNTLLGRMSPGLGGPETIGVGANLAFANGALNAPAPFIISGLGLGGPPSASDLVPLSQGGQNAALPYDSFMGGLGGLDGISGSNLTAQPTGGIATRRIADIFSDALSVESFGAVGDGITDDTAAFTAALATGRPLRLDGKVYVVNGPVMVTSTQAIIGVAGASVITRNVLTSPNSWITFASPVITVCGVEFDAASLAGSDMPAVAVSEVCMNGDFVQCRFTNAVGSTSGCGLICNLAPSATVSIAQSISKNNALHGFYATGSGSFCVLASVAQVNGSSGIRIDVGVAAAVRANSCNGNTIGISVGNWDVGPGSAQDSFAFVCGNVSSLNTQWGAAVATSGGIVDSNSLLDNGNTSAGGGLIARAVNSRVTANLITDGCYGIDARGCLGCLIDENHVTAATTGLALGGSQGLSVRSNVFLGNGWAIGVSAIEPSLSLTPTGPVTIAENWIGFTSAQGGGILVTDGAQGLAITGNDVNGSGSATLDQAMWLHTDAAIVDHNRWNNQARFKVIAGTVAGLEALVVPDVADDVLVTSAPSPIQSILTAHQADTIGQVAFIKVTNGGSGYTQAQVVISGSGLGATASAIVGNGEIAWIVVTNPGSGYGIIGSPAIATITGDGSGAAAAVYIGLPVLEGRQLRLSCNTQLQLSLAGSAPPQQSWTGYASTIPAYGSVDLEGTFGNWRAVAFPPVDYLAPTGDGGAIIQTVNSGNLILRPASGGALHIASAAETVGCTSSVGRGSPLGIVAAPPGSDFRNLNGGPGNTFWIKQQNSDATGWAAIG
jgi:hypothetical protein